MIDRKINWEKMILAFLIAVFLFCLGLFIGYLARGIVEGAAMNVEEGMRNEIMTLETLSMLGEKYPCDSITLNLMSDKLDYLGDLITTLEVKKGKFDSEVLELKKIYSLLQVRHMLLIQDKDEKCSENYNIFIFFYSNKEECKNLADKMSFILSYLRNKHNDVRVYSFDVDLDSDIVYTLMKRYNIDKCDAVILNDKRVNATFESSDDVERLLK